MFGLAGELLRGGGYFFGSGRAVLNHLTQLVHGLIDLLGSGVLFTRR